MSKYMVKIGGHSWARGPVLDVDTLRAARETATQFGTTADWARVEDAQGRQVARFVRDPNGNGRRWYMAEGRIS